MATLMKTPTGYKVSYNEAKKIVHHTDGDWLVLKENSQCYLLSQGDLYSVRTKDNQGKIGFYTGDSSSIAYDVFCQIGNMHINV